MMRLNFVPFAGLALVSAIACAKDTQRAQGSDASGDTTAAAAANALPAPDTMKAAAPMESDSARLARAANTKGMATKGKPAGVTRDTSVLGRDSTPTNPKVIALPVIRDTAKKKPPR